MNISARDPENSNHVLRRDNMYSLPFAGVFQEDLVFVLSPYFFCMSGQGVLATKQLTFITFSSAGTSNFLGEIASSPSLCPFFENI